MGKKNRIGLQFSGWQELMQSIDRAAGEEGLKKATEAALKASKEYVNEQVTAIMRKANMPANGKFWTGDTKATLDKNFSVEWKGFTGEIKIGFNLSESLVSNFLMYGTPRHEPPMAAVPGLYDVAGILATEQCLTRKNKAKPLKNGLNGIWGDRWKTV